MSSPESLIYGRLDCIVERFVNGGISQALYLDENGYYGFKVFDSIVPPQTLSALFTWNPWAGDKTGRLLVTLPSLPGADIQVNDMLLLRDGGRFYINEAYLGNSPNAITHEPLWHCLCQRAMV